jgi:hypothetical protein
MRARAQRAARTAKIILMAFIEWMGAKAVRLVAGECSEKSEYAVTSYQTPLRPASGNESIRVAGLIGGARPSYSMARTHFTMCGKGFTPRKRAFGSSKAICQAWSSGNPM